MFGFLKKKLKESVEKISKAIKGEEEEKAEEHIAEQIEISKPVEVKPAPAETKIEESAEEELVKEEVPQEIPKEVEKEIRGEIKEAAVEHKTEEKIEKEKPKIEVTKPETGKKRGFLERIRQVVTEKVVEEKDIVPILSDIQTSLVESDVALEAAEKITDDLKAALVGKSVKRGQVEQIIKDSLRKSVFEILDQPDTDIFEMARKSKPLKVIFLGFNGAGKTTTIARLGYLLKQRGLKLVFAAGDTWRAAAIEQIEIHGSKLGIPVIKQKYGADSAAVIFDAVKAAQSRGCDVVLADTAGRSHANANLMDEMKKIVRVNKPDLKILVVDSLTGNDAVEQAKTFNEAVGVDGVIMTKADVYEKGGAVLSTAWAIKKPILYIGVGQDYKDLQQFDPKKVADGLLQ